jgi:molybdate/tungstate transport system substrate-binding protein
MKENEKSEGKNVELVVYHAGIMGRMIGLVAGELRKQNPGVTVTREKGGSLNLVRKIAAQEGRADIMAAADYKNIDDFLYGKYASWFGIFATTSMVLAYTDKSKDSDKINVNNWTEIVSQPGIRLNAGDRNADPGIYRRVMIGKLAEKFYGQPGLADKIEANATQLDRRSFSVPLAKSGDIDYLFMYKTAALTHGLKYIELPPQVNLSDPAYLDLYRSVEVVSSGVTVKGDVIAFGITIPDNAQQPELALKYLEILLSPAGAKMIEDGGFTPARPFKVTGNVPAALKKFT